MNARQEVQVSENDDSRLVQEILDGHPELFARLVSDYQGPVYNLALRMTGSPEDAADLTQEAFVRAWINLDKFDPERRFFIWLYTLSLNIIRSHLKKKSSRPSLEYCPERTRLEQDAKSDPPEQLISRQQGQDMQQMLLGLPVDQREALLLRFFSDVSYREMTIS